MAKKFNVKEIVITDPKKSSLDMSGSVKGTGKIGRLIPVFTQELLPNTSIKYTPNTLARFVPLAVPLMSNMAMRHHVIAVPFRQLITNWETFITGGEFNVDDSTLPHFTLAALYGDLESRVLSFADQLVEGDLPGDFIEVFQSTRNGFNDIGYGTMWDLLFTEYVREFKDAFTESSDSWTPGLVELWNTMCGILMNTWIGSGSLLDYLGYPVRDWSVLLNTFNMNDSDAKNETAKVVRIINVAIDEGGVEKDYSLFGGFNVSGEVDFETEYNDLPIRAYYRIWYYYFRDQNLDVIGEGFTPEDLKAESGSWTRSKDWLERLLLIRPCAWSKDLFNTTTLQAYENNAFVPVSTSSAQPDPVELSKVKVFQNDGLMHEMSVPATWLSSMKDAITTQYGAETANKMILRTNDIGVTGFTLQNMKKVESLARWLDKNLYAGWCYADQLSSHFGVRYSDARMQLPEYVGGTKSMVSVQTLTNTTNTSEDIAGSQAAYAQGITANDGCDYYAEEHCMLFDIMSIVPELSYKYSSPKHLLHLKKFDFAFPEFAQLGCDIVPSCNVANSINLAVDPGDNNYSANITPFAYADRYYEYKNNVNRLTGKLVDDNPLYTFTQDYRLWKSSAYVDAFVNIPKLNADFIHCVPSVDNFVSDSVEYEFMFDHDANVKATIPLPVVEYV